MTPETRLRLRRAKFILLLSLPAWLYLIPTDGIYHGTTLCLYTRVFGVECWGCGMSRAVFSCLYLDFAGAWGYNRLIVVVMPLLVVYWVQLVVRAWRRAFPRDL